MNLNVYVKKFFTLRLPKATYTLLITLLALGLNAQTIFWSDNFDAPAGGTNNNNAGVGWSLNVGQAAGGNEWYINAGSGCFTGNRLHISCGGFLCNFLGGPTSSIYNAGATSYDKFSSSPNISTVGRTNITLRFRWRCAGEANADYGLLRLSNDGGATWTDLPTRYQNTSSCQTETITLPSQYENISNFRIAFRWINNANNAGSDPPFGVDDIELSVPSVSCPVTITNQQSTQPTCNGSNNGTITITATGGSPLTYTINSGTPQNNQTGSFTNLAPGTYTVSVSDGNCSTPGTNITITNPAAVPTPNATANTPLCVGDTLKLTANNITNATYAWSGPNSNNFNVQNPTKLNVQLADAGTYSVVATVGGCNSTAATVSVVVNARPLGANAQYNGPICEGDTLKITSNTVANATYSWTGMATFNVQNPVIPNATVANSGPYQVIVTVNGCSSPSSTVIVTVNPRPASPTASSNAPLCEGATLNLTASTVAGATAYNWTGPNNFPNQQNPTKANATSADGGTYTVRAVQGSCSSVPATVNVIIAPQPSAPVVSSNSPVCEGGTLNLTAANIPGATFNWTGPNNFPNNQNPSKSNVTFADSGTYTVIASIGSCVSPPASVTVAVEPGPVLTTVSSNSPVCTGSTLNLTADNVTGATYAWTGPNGFSDSQQNSSRTNVTLPDSGDYTITVTLGNCSATATIQVMVYETPAAPVLTASNTTICSGDSLEVCAPTGFASYLWNQNGETTNCGKAKFAGGLWVDVTATNGCSVRSNSLNITIHPVPSVSIIKQGDTLSTFGATAYQWFKDGVAISGATSPIFIATSPGTYTVQITDANGCKATSSGLAITGLKESALFSALEIFPNPASGQFMIRYQGESLPLVQMTLFNVIGEQVRQQTFGLLNGATIPVDVSSLAKGMYLLQLQSGADKSVRRVVVE